MEQKHTPEPWGSYVSIFDGVETLAVAKKDIPENNRHRAICAISPTSAMDDEDIANARRIVACVNACEGLPLEYLESSSVGNNETLGSIKEEREKVFSALSILLESETVAWNARGGCPYMRAQVLTSFDPSVYRRYGIPAGILALTVDPVYWDSLYKKLKEHVEKNDKRILSGQEPFKLEVKINVDYRHRSLSANAWLWAMHTIEADIINGKQVATKWHDINDVTPEMVHEDYMDRFAPRAEVIVDEWMVPVLAETARIVSQEKLDGKVRLVLMKTSSYMNAREFSQLSHEVESQMLSYGIPLDNYLEYKKLADQIPEFDKSAANDTKPQETAKEVKPWHHMTREEQKAADPEKFDEEMNLQLF